MSDYEVYSKGSGLFMAMVDSCSDFGGSYVVVRHSYSGIGALEE